MFPYPVVYSTPIFAAIARFIKTDSDSCKFCLQSTIFTFNLIPLKTSFIENSSKQHYFYPLKWFVLSKIIKTQFVINSTFIDNKHNSNILLPEQHVYDCATDMASGAYL